MVIKAVVVNMSLMITQARFPEARGPKEALDRSRGRSGERGPVAGGLQVLRRPVGGRSSPWPPAI